MQLGSRQVIFGLSLIAAVLAFTTPNVVHADAIEITCGTDVVRPDEFSVTFAKDFKTGRLLLRGDRRVYNVDLAMTRSLVFGDRQKRRWQIYDIHGMQIKSALALSETMFKIEAQNVQAVRSNPLGGAFEAFFLQFFQGRREVSPNFGEIYCLRVK